MSATGTHEPTAVLPDGIASMLPGPELAVALARVEPSRLSGHDAVIYLQARERQLSYEEVMELSALVEVGLRTDAETCERADAPTEFAADEIRMALGWSITRARNRLTYGLNLIQLLPEA